MCLRQRGRAVRSRSRISMVKKEVEGSVFSIMVLSRKRGMRSESKLRIRIRIRMGSSEMLFLKDFCGFIEKRKKKRRREKNKAGGEWAGHSLPEAARLRSEYLSNRPVSLMNWSRAPKLPRVLSRARNDRGRLMVALSL